MEAIAEYWVEFPLLCISFLLATYFTQLWKVMAPHSSTLAWKIPWMEEPGGLESMQSLRVEHNWATSLSLFTFMHWRRKWQPTPVFLPGESQGWGSLIGCRVWGRTESDWSDLAAAAGSQNVTGFHKSFLGNPQNKTHIRTSDSAKVLPRKAPNEKLGWQRII